MHGRTTAWTSGRWACKLCRVRGHPTAEQAELIATRNARILRNYSDGENLATLGRLYGLTRERVRQIVKDAGAPMPLEFKCGVENCDTAPRTPNSYCWAHQRRFDRFGDPLGVKPLRRDQHGTRASYHEGGCRCALCRKFVADRVRDRVHRLHPEMRYYAPRDSDPLPDERQRSRPA
jgi:hypothetical protein